MRSKSILPICLYALLAATAWSLPNQEGIQAEVRPASGATLKPSPTPGVTLPSEERLEYPTPGPLPISAWRAPLYPVPWAPGPYDHFFFQRPIAADQVNWPLPDYRYGGVYFGPDIVHTGIDIDAAEGAQVIAAGPGSVVWAGYGLFSHTDNRDDPYGLAVAIQHDFGFEGQPLFTIYAHMSSIQVEYGQRIAAGDPVGMVGNTGHSTGAHLHFEIRLGENTIYSTRNPELWLAPPQGRGILVGRITNRSGSPLTHVRLLLEHLDSGREWEVFTYGPVVVNADDHYQDNLALSDLPPGGYQVIYNYLGEEYVGSFQIYPGLVTIVSFRGADGFLPAEAPPGFHPEAATPSP